METGEIVKIDPKITGLKNWVEGVIIKIRNNPFIGKEIATKTTNGMIYFDSEKYFKSIKK